MPFIRAWHLAREGHAKNAVARSIPGDGWPIARDTHSHVRLVFHLRRQPWVPARVMLQHPPVLLRRPFAKLT